MNFNKLLAAMGLLWMLIAAFSCNKASVDDKSVIQGTIIGGAGKTFVIKNSSPFSLSVDSIKLNEHGQFRIEKSLINPQYFTFFIGSNSFYIYLRPGDSLMLSTELSDLYGKLKFSGDASLYNDYLARSTNISYHFKDKIYDLFAKNELQAIVGIDSLRAIHESELFEIQSNATKLDPYFMSIENERILYEWGLYHLYYPQYFQYLHPDTTLGLTSNYQTYLAELNLNNPKLASLPIYVSFLENYVNVKAELIYKNRGESDKLPFIVTQLNELKKLTLGDSLNSILSYLFVKQQVDYEGYKYYKETEKQYLALCKDSNLVHSIKSKLDDWAHLAKGQTAMDFTFEDLKGTKISLSDFNGKWVFIDIWASWCVPCLVEIPALLTLEEEYRNKNIVFMSISVDQSKSAWEKIIKERKLKGVQLWAGKSEVIRNFYKVSGIPRFLLIDPQGKIYEASANRPSENLKTSLELLLK